MIYARSLHNVTIHHATQTADARGRVACGTHPKWNCWTGQDEWRFYAEIPPSEGSWRNTPPDELLCHRCFKKQAGK